MAQACDPREIHGASVFQLSGPTTLSGARRPAVSLGRLEFDGEGERHGLETAETISLSGTVTGRRIRQPYGRSERVDDSGRDGQRGFGLAGNREILAIQTDPGDGG